MSNFTLMACDIATGAYTAVLPDYAKLQISFEMSDVGAISFEYPKNGLGFSTINADTRIEIAVLKDGIEMDDARFRVQSVVGDEVKDDDLISFSGVSLLNRFKKAIVYSGTGSTTVASDQQFISATPGGILKALFDQNAARSGTRVCDEITYASFGNTTDSAGNAWAFSFGNITYTVGVAYLSVIQNMVDNGMIEVKLVGRDLRVYNAGGLGIDRTVGASPVVLRRGVDFIEAPQTRTNEQIAAIGLIAGDNDVLLQVTDPSVAAAWGSDEIFISQGGISDSTTLGVVAQNQLELSSQVRAQRTRKLAVHGALFQPYTDFRVSDFIFNDSGTGVSLERLRIRQMVLEVEESGINTASLVLNDKFLEREIAISRKVSGILGGASAGGSVAIPTPSDPATDTTTPSAPASASAISGVYVNENGISVAQSSVSWAAVTTNTDLSTIADLDHYEVQHREDQFDTVTTATSLSPGRDDPLRTRLFDRRGKGYGWLGADGGASTRATSGKDFWLFADTNIGSADQKGKVSNWSFVHNSVVLTDNLDSTVFQPKWGYGNRLTADNAFLSATVGGWVSTANSTVTRSTTIFKYGTASLRLAATAAADASAGLPTGLSGIGVTAGTTYSFMAHLRSDTTARQVALAIRWYNSGGGLISTSTMTNAAGSTSAWQRYVYTAVAPPLAVAASPQIIFRSAGVGQLLYGDCFMFCQGDAAMQSWNDPARSSGFGGPVDLVCLEDFGGAALGTGSTITNQIFWVDEVFTNGGKIYGIMTRYTPLGVFQNSIFIAQWDGTTHAYEGLTQFTTGDVAVWGNAVYQDASFVYLFGVDSTDAPATQDQFLMRVPVGNPLAGTKEYWVSGTTWSTTRASAVAVRTGFANYIGGVIKIGATFFAVYTVYGEGTMKYLTATAIQGPWTDQGAFYTQPEIGSGLVSYFPRIHDQMSSNSGIPMSYSVNGSVQGHDSLDNIRYYAPKFLSGPPPPIGATVPTTNWSANEMIESGVTTAYFGNLIPGSNFQARVRAVDYNGHFSAWTSTTTIKLADDTTPPNRPSTPIVSQQFQGIRIEWDGLDFQGGPPPADWDFTEVHMSEVANFQPGPLTKVDSFITRLGGVSPQQGLEYGVTYYARFVMVDIRGNRSLPSDAASVAPEQLVNTAEIGAKLIAGAQIADNAIAVRSLTVAAFEASVVPNGTFETDATDASNVSTNMPYGWSASPWTVGAGYTASLETASPISGLKSLKLTAATAADGGRYQSAIFPITEGKLLAVSVKVRGSRAVALANAFEVHIVCGSTEANTGAFPAGGTSVWGTAAGLPATTGIQTLELQRIPEAGMKFARVFLSVNASADGSGWAGTFDDVIVAPVGGSAFIADASILNAKIANLAVNDAKISNLSVGKLTAGILGADVVVGARIKTADTGARVELNSAGLQAFNAAGNKTVDVAAATGNAVFTGSFKTAFASDATPHLEIVDSGDRTTMYFYGPSTNYAYINSPTVTSAPSIGINTGVFLEPTMLYDARHRLFLANGSIYLESVRIGGAGNAYGGRVSLQATAATFHVLDTTGVERGAFFLSGTGSRMISKNTVGSETGSLYIEDDGSWWLRGRFTQDNPDSTLSALFCGTWNVAANTTFTVSYGLTMASRPQVLCTPHSGSGIGDWRLSNFSTTSFTYIQQNSVAINLNYWCFRTNP